MHFANFLNWIEVFFEQIGEFIVRDYVSEENKFVRKRNMTQKDITNYVLIQTGRTNGVEAFSFYKRLKSKIRGFSTRQAIGKQRKFLLPKLYSDMNTKFIDKIYEDSSKLPKFKGYLVFSNDGTDLQLPNEEEIKKLYHSEFSSRNRSKIILKEVSKLRENLHSRLKGYLSRARVSCIVDSNTNLIIDTKMVNKEISETNLAIEHIDDLKKRNYDLKNIIFVYDRGYNALELMVKLVKEETNFLMRLRENMYVQEIKQMATNDEILEIKLTRDRKRNIKNPELLKFLENKKYIKLRITRVKLENGDTELLISNLPKKEPTNEDSTKKYSKKDDSKNKYFTDQDLRELYNKRWKIETVYDFLKNVMNIENFTGYGDVIIKQDFYAKILLYNISMAIKKYTEHMLKEKNKLRDDQAINFNITVGIFKEQILDILYSKTRNEIRAILKITYNAVKKHKITINTTSRKDMEIKSPDKFAKFPKNKRISTL